MFQIGNGMTVCEMEKLPIPSLRNRAVPYLLKHFGEATVAHHRRAVENFLFTAGYHAELVQMQKQHGWLTRSRHAIAAHLVTGQLKPLLALAKTRPASRSERIYTKDMLSPIRLACLLGQHEPAVAFLQKLDKNQPVSSDNQKASVIHQALLPVIVSTECTLRTKKHHALVQKGIDVIRLSLKGLIARANKRGKGNGFSIRQILWADLFQARLFLQQKQPDKALQALRYEPYKLHWVDFDELRLVWVAQKLLLLGQKKDWKAFWSVLHSEEGSQGYWKSRGWFPYAKLSFFPTNFVILSPERWLRVAAYTEQVAKALPEAKQAKQHAADLRFLAGFAMASQGDKRYQKVLASLSSHPMAQTYLRMFDAFWEGKPLTKQEAWVGKYRDKYIRHGMWPIQRVNDMLFSVKEGLALTKNKQTQEAMLGSLSLVGSLTFGRLLLWRGVQIQYGRRMGLKRVSLWKQHDARWRALLAKQPNWLLLHQQGM
jgi:hypothetical protein